MLAATASPTCGRWPCSLPAPRPRSLYFISAIRFWGRTVFTLDTPMDSSLPTRGLHPGAATLPCPYSQHPLPWVSGCPSPPPVPASGRAPTPPTGPRWGPDCPQPAAAGTGVTQVYGMGACQVHNTLQPAFMDPSVIKKDTHEQ